MSWWCDVYVGLLTQVTITHLLIWIRFTLPLKGVHEGVYSFTYTSLVDTATTKIMIKPIAVQKSDVAAGVQ